MDPIDITLRNIFASTDVARRAELIMGGKKLIHYCSAETALKIIKNREIWLRNVRVMNDFMEVNHGFNLILSSLQPKADTTIDTGLTEIKKALDAIHPGLADQAFTRFRAWSPHIQNETYVTCLSEHLDNETDDGRLSMWRNYSSGQAGVGLVINTGLFGGTTDELGIFSSPVSYMSEQDLEQSLMEVAAKIRDASSLLAGLQAEQIIGHYFLLLRTIAHGSKHPGFREEREWRIFHTLQLDQIKRLSVESETLNGIPQRVIKLKFDSSFPGLAISDLVSEVLIGPSQYQHVIGSALVDELRRAGKADVENVLKYSPIPLRT